MKVEFHTERTPSPADPTAARPVPGRSPAMKTLGYREPSAETTTPSDDFASAIDSLVEIKEKVASGEIHQVRERLQTHDEDAVELMPEALEETMELDFDLSQKVGNGTTGLIRQPSNIGEVNPAIPPTPPAASDDFSDLADDDNGVALLGDPSGPHFPNDNVPEDRFDGGDSWRGDEEGREWSEDDEASALSGQQSADRIYPMFEEENPFDVNGVDDSTWQQVAPKLSPPASETPEPPVQAPAQPESSVAAPKPKRKSAQPVLFSLSKPKPADEPPAPEMQPPALPVEDPIAQEPEMPAPVAEGPLAIDTEKAADSLRQTSRPSMIGGLGTEIDENSPQGFTDIGPKMAAPEPVVAEPMPAPDQAESTPEAASLPKPPSAWPGKVTSLPIPGPLDASAESKVEPVPADEPVVEMAPPAITPTVEQTAPAPPQWPSSMIAEPIAEPIVPAAVASTDPPELSWPTKAPEETSDPEPEIAVANEEMTTPRPEEWDRKVAPAADEASAPAFGAPLPAEEPDASQDAPTISFSISPTPETRVESTSGLVSPEEEPILSTQEIAQETVSVPCPACEEPLKVQRQFLGVSGQCVWCQHPLVAFETFAGSISAVKLDPAQAPAAEGDTQTFFGDAESTEPEAAAAVATEVPPEFDSLTPVDETTFDVPAAAVDQDNPWAAPAPPAGVQPMAVEAMPPEVPTQETVEMEEMVESEPESSFETPVSEEPPMAATPMPEPTEVVEPTADFPAQESQPFAGADTLLPWKKTESTEELVSRPSEGADERIEAAMAAFSGKIGDEAPAPEFEPVAESAPPIPDESTVFPGPVAESATPEMSAPEMETPPAMETPEIEMPPAIETPTSFFGPPPSEGGFPEAVVDAPKKSIRRQLDLPQSAPPAPQSPPPIPESIDSESAEPEGFGPMLGLSPATDAGAVPAPFGAGGLLPELGEENSVDDQRSEADLEVEAFDEAATDTVVEKKSRGKGALVILALLFVAVMGAVAAAYLIPGMSDQIDSIKSKILPQTPTVDPMEFKTNETPEPVTAPSESPAAGSEEFDLGIFQDRRSTPVGADVDIHLPEQKKAPVGLGQVIAAP